MTDTTNRSVVRAFSVVDELANSGSVGVSELARRLDMPVSTTYDTLQSLVETGYVLKDGTQYRISTRFLEVGNQQRHRMGIYTAVRDELAAVAEETGEQATLFVEEAGEAVLLAVFEGDDAVSLLAYPGARMPLHANAGGKAILAHMPDERVSSLLDGELAAVTKHTITDSRLLREQLETIHERGYAVDEGERIAGIVCVAVPVLDRDDVVRGAICVCGPASRMGETRRRAVAEIAQRAANITQVNIDYV